MSGSGRARASKLGPFTTLVRMMKVLSAVRLYVVLHCLSNCFLFFYLW